MNEDTILSEGESENVSFKTTQTRPICVQLIEKAEHNCFFKTLSKKFATHIPKYIQILLTFCGFDSPASIKNFSNEDFLTLKEFAKYELPYFLTKDANKIEDFFNIHIRK